MAFQVELDKFSGPLQLLLELIEGEELPISDVSLATVTDEYLNYINKSDVPPEELADFLIIATKLLYIKSKAILPMLQFEEEEDGGNLAAQLKMYREFVEASKVVEAFYGSEKKLFVRQKQTLPPSPKFSPPQGLVPQQLSDAFQSVLKRLEPFFALREQSIRRVISVQEKIKNIHDAILERSHLTFREVVGKGGSRVDIVVSFLALLELMKQQVVKVVQSDAFGEITIKHAE